MPKNASNNQRNRVFGNMGGKEKRILSVTPLLQNHLKWGWKIHCGGRVRIGLAELPNEFRVVLDRNFLNKLLLNGKNRVGTWDKLAKRIKLDYTSLVDLRNGEVKSILMAVLRRLASIAGVSLEEIEKNCAYVFKMRSVRVKIPIYPTPELASLVAHGLGDGSLAEERFQVEYKNKDIDCIQDVLAAAKTVFNIEVSATKDERGIYLVMLPSTVGQILHLAGAVQGNKTKKDFDVPYWIKNGVPEIKKFFLRALFDDEGSVCVGKKSSNIKIFMSKLASKKDSLISFFESIRRMLSDFGITSGKVQIYREYWVENERKIMLGFWITGKRNLKIFAQKVSFSSTKKQKKLIVAIKSYKHEIWNEEVDKKILDVLQENGPRKTYELAKSIKKNRSVVLRHLHRLKSEGSVSFSEYKLTNGLRSFLWYLENKGGDGSG